MNKYLQNISYKSQQIYVLRLDVLHPNIQGNKYYKLKYNIEQAIKEEKKYVLSFGGEYSNHIHALSLTGKQNNLQTIGVIRADKPHKLNHTLSEVVKNGMELHFTNRTNFRILRKLIQEENESEVFDLLKEFVPNISKTNTYLIPEGGTNALALKGTQEILDNTTIDYDKICVSIGTGGTIAGLISSKEDETKLIGFPSLKGNFFERDITNLLKKISDKDYPNWTLNHNYHFGGFASFDEKLVQFINDFYSTYKIPLDTIYTSKMFYGIFDMIDNGEFNHNEKILAIHTGGLQGNKGFNEKNGNLLNF